MHAAIRNLMASKTTAPTYDPANPIFVQPDRSILVETFNPRYAEARDAIAPFAELEKSPEHIHTYRITNLSLWNAAAAGFTVNVGIVVVVVVVGAGVVVGSDTHVLTELRCFPAPQVIAVVVGASVVVGRAVVVASVMDNARIP